MDSAAAELAPITAILAGLTPDAPRRLRLSVQTKPGATPHTAIFHVLKESLRNRATGKYTVFYTLYNKCILIASGDTSISANTDKDTPCFEPRLISDPAGTADRITTTDVLQVLKTKLMLARPGQNPNDIVLNDSAAIDNVSITPFRLLRDGQPMYAKYGYESTEVPPIKDAIQHLSWGDVATLPFVASMGWTYATAYEEMTGTLPEPETPLVAALAPLTLEQEAAFVQKHKSPSKGLYPMEIRFSRALFNTILKLTNLPYYANYLLKIQSDAWSRWSTKIRITSVTLLDADEDANVMPNMGGGFRHGRSPRTRRRHLTQSRVHGRGGRRADQRRAQTARRVQ